MVKKASNLRFLGVNVLIALGIVLVILIVVMIWLKKYTDHGHEIEVPQITGLYIQEAENLLSSSELTLEVIDSTFSQKVPYGTIVEQMPPAESKVKKNRAIYVVINASAQRKVPLPELHDVSYRQAENVLRQLGLEIGEIVYEPSAYRDLILDLRDGEQSLEAGSLVAVGSVITLVVGQGQGTEMVEVPDLMGLSLVDARSLLLVRHLTMGKIEYDEQPTDDNREQYIVYMQEPQARSYLLEGSNVHVKLSKDKQKAVTAANVEDEDEFF